MGKPSPPLPPGKEEHEIADQAMGWFSRLRMSTVSQRDVEAFEQWCSAHPSHQQVYDRVCAMWDNPGLRVAALRADDARRLRRAAPCISWRKSVAVAAAVVLLVFVPMHWDVITRAQADYYTDVGERTTVRLPDQSVVTMNTQTAIAVEYESAVRKIRLLKGQALFKVTSDPLRPFVVEHHGIHTRAVGTEFIVRGLPDGAQVTVAEGKVTVTKPGASWRAIPLEAGRELRADGGRAGEPYDIDIAVATAWIQGRLVVTGARLDEVIKEVGRYHRGALVIWNRELEHMRVTGTYNLNDPSKLLVTLSKTLRFHTVSLADRVTVLY